MGYLISQFLTVLTKPADALKMMRESDENTGIVPSLVYVVVLSLISGLIASIIGMFVPPLPVTQGLFGKGGMWAVYMIAGPLLVLLGSFASSFLLWGITDGFFKGSLAQYKTTYRLLALTATFYPISALITPIPKVGIYLGWALQAWVIIFVIWGLIAVRGAKMLQTILIILITIVLLVLAGILGPRISRSLGVAPSAYPALGTGDEMFPGGAMGGDDIDKFLEEQEKAAKTEKK